METLLSSVLLVDDSSVIRKFLIHVLKKRYSTLKIVEAETGLRAIEALSKDKFDLLLVDVNMPEMNGLEFTYSVKQNSEYSAVPIIIATTEGSEESRKRGHAAGANAYLVKPVKPKQLFEAINQIL